MTASNISFQKVAELASHLSPDERLRLVAWIGADLNESLTKTTSERASPGSAAAILRAMREPPHLSAEDVDELNQMIAAGKMPVRQNGVFDRGDIK